MEFYPIKGQLRIKKIEPTNEHDLWLLHHLTMDKEVYGLSSESNEFDMPGYLWNLEKEAFLNLNYVQHDELY